MSSDWQVVALEEVVGAVNTGLDAIKRAPIVERSTGIKCLRIQDVSQSKNFCDWGNTEVRDQDFEKYRLRKNEIIMARTCSPGICLLVKSDLKAVFNNGLARIRANEERIDPRFLLYIFKSKEFSDYIYGISHGTSVQLNMKVGDLTKFRLPLPPLKIQHRISDLLAVFDDRITLLRETNATLEAIAQALFKSWFVDFDPVRAKQQGLAPEGMDEATAALFPDGFEESELGPVPRGWRVGVLGDELKIAYGKNLPTSQLLDSGYPVYGGNGQIGFIDKYLYETRQVLIACRGAASGKVNQSSPKAFVTNNSLVLESNESTALPFGYLKWYMLRSDLMPFVTGSAQPQVTIDNLKVFKLLIPCAEALKAFESFSSVIEERIEENDQQAQTLATLRDTLLPRLISGQLRLPDVDGHRSR